MSTQTMNPGPGYSVSWYELRSLGVRSPPDHRSELAADVGMEVRGSGDGALIPVSSVSTMTWVSEEQCTTIVVARPAAPSSVPASGQEFQTVLGGLVHQAGLRIERYSLDPAGQLVDLILIRHDPVS